MNRSLYLVLQRRGTGHGRRLSLLASATAAALATLAAPAHAQQAAAPAAPAASSAATGKTDDGVTQQIIITASKRSEKQREVAGNVSVVSGDELERRGALDQEDVFKLTPGVQFFKGGADNALISIRGVNSSPAAAFLGYVQAPVAVFIDDIPMTDPHYYMLSPDLSPFDLQRVEVLRGPQGTLFGSSSIGGVVRYVLNRPNLTSVEASVLGTVNSVSGGDSGHSVFAMANAPLINGQLALRAVLFDRQDGGYIDNPKLGLNNSNKLGQKGGRVMLDWKLTPGIVARGTFVNQQSKQEDTMSVSPDPKQLTSDVPLPVKRDTEFTIASVQLEAELGAGLKLTSITAHVEKEVDGFGSGATTSAIPTTTRNRTRSFTQELRIGTTDPAATVSYVAGLYLLEYEARQDLDARFANGSPYYTYGFNGKTQDVALFADGEWRITPAWSLGLGGRSYNSKLNFDYVTNIPIYAYSDAGAREHKEKGFLPKANVKYRFGENMAYGLVSRGYRNGGINDNPGATTYNPDKTWNYEVGLRLQLAKGLTLDTTAFYIDWKDLPVTLLDPLGNGYFANVGSAKSQGLEVQLNWSPAKDTTLSAGLAYTDAKTTTAFDSSDGNAAAGSRLPNTPKLQGAVQVSQRFAGPFETQGRASVAVSHQGERSGSLVYAGKAPAYTSADLRLEFARGSWTVAGFVNNASDVRGVASVVPRSDGVSYQLIRPRTLGLSLRYDL
jgi:outer membrane receptor protein involved in Fe transport